MSVILGFLLAGVSAVLTAYTFIHLPKWGFSSWQTLAGFGGSIVILLILLIMQYRNEHALILIKIMLIPSITEPVMPSMPGPTLSYANALMTAAMATPPKRLA